MNQNELMHYGVLGMKWGIRRYQNYDGSYTKKGMQHYRKSEKEYDEAKDKYKAKKAERKAGRATKDDVKYAKGEMKIAERKLKRDYKQLKRDKLGDQGKQLYQQGKTITGSRQHYSNALESAGMAIAVSSILAYYGQYTAAQYAGYIGVGAAVGSAILGLKNDYEATRLRAYYGHSRPTSTR